VSELKLTPGITLAPADTVPDGGAVAVRTQDEHGPVSLLLTRVGGAVSAFVNRCSHAAYPLERPDGRVIVHDKRYILCTAHGASFELGTGACAGGPCNGEPLTRVPITIRDGMVVTD